MGWVPAACVPPPFHSLYIWLLQWKTEGTHRAHPQSQREEGKTDGQAGYSTHLLAQGHRGAVSGPNPGKPRPGHHQSKHKHRGHGRTPPRACTQQRDGQTPTSPRTAGSKLPPAPPSPMTTPARKAQRATPPHYETPAKSTEGSEAVPPQGSANPQHQKHRPRGPERRAAPTANPLNREQTQAPPEGRTQDASAMPALSHARQRCGATVQPPPSSRQHKHQKPIPRPQSRTQKRIPMASPARRPTLQPPHAPLPEALLESPAGPESQRRRNDVPRGRSHAWSSVPPRYRPSAVGRPNAMTVVQ